MPRRKDAMALRLPASEHEESSQQHKSTDHSFVVGSPKSQSVNESEEVGVFELERRVAASTISQVRRANFLSRIMNINTHQLDSAMDQAQEPGSVANCAASIHFNGNLPMANSRMGNLQLQQMNLQQMNSHCHSHSGNEDLTGQQLDYITANNSLKSGPQVAPITSQNNTKNSTNSQHQPTTTCDLISGDSKMLMQPMNSIHEAQASFPFNSQTNTNSNSTSLSSKSHTLNLDHRFQPNNEDSNQQSSSSHTTTTRGGENEKPRAEFHSTPADESLSLGRVNKLDGSSVNQKQLESDERGKRIMMIQDRDQLFSVFINNQKVKGKLRIVSWLHMFVHLFFYLFVCFSPHQMICFHIQRLSMSPFSHESLCCEFELTCT